METKNQRSQNLTFISLIILFHVFLNLLWHSLNTAPPTWDSAGHLVLSYIFADKLPDLFTGQMDYTAWLKISSYYPPFVQMLGGFLFTIFGRNYELIILLGTAFLVMAMVYLYLIVLRYFRHDYRLAAFTVFIFSFFPHVWEQSRQFHLDIPLVALVLAAFYHLIRSDTLRDKKHSLLFFIFFTLAQSTKWYGFVYLVVPFFFEVLAKVYYQKDYFNRGRIWNVLIGSVMVLFVSVPWYVVNYQSIIENVRIAATADAGDPREIFSYESIFHYLKLMTSHQIGAVSVVALFAAIYFVQKRKDIFSRYLLLMTVVPYVVFTVIQNKDLRYILPLTPLFAFYIAYYLMLGSQTKLMLKAVLFSSYLVFLYFFLSFNQFIQMPKNLKIIAYAMGGPYYAAWVNDPKFFSYDNNDWQNDEIIKKIQEKASKDKSIRGVYNVLELSDNKFYSIASMDLHRVQNSYNNMILTVPYNRLSTFTPQEMTDYLATMKYAIVPTTPGPSGLRNIDVLNQLVTYFKSGQNKEFSLVTTFDMPDGNKLDLYERKGSLGYRNPGVLEESLDIYVAEILLVDREKIGGTNYSVTLIMDSGEKNLIKIGSDGGNQRRIPLQGVRSFKIDLPMNMQNIKEIRGWELNNSDFTRDSKYLGDKTLAGNEMVYQNFTITPKIPVIMNNVEPIVDVVYTHKNEIEITLINPLATSFVAYATTGWQWNNATLDTQNRRITIPVEGLLQVEVSSPHQQIKGFPDDWGYFICYNGNAVCFYPVVAGL